MRIAWVVPCRYVEVNQNLATIVGGGIDRVFIPEFPPPAPVHILCATRIAASHAELDDPDQEEPTHALTCRVMGPDMAVISELVQPFGMKGEVDDPTMDPAAIIPIGVVFQPVALGQHTIEIAIDDRGVSIPINVAIGGPGL